MARSKEVRPRRRYTKLFAFSCSVCRKEFHATRDDAKMCGAKCRKRASRLKAKTAKHGRKKR